jgi:hypothetical protein
LALPGPSAKQEVGMATARTSGWVRTLRRLHGVDTSATRDFVRASLATAAGAVVLAALLVYVLGR